MPSAVDSTAVCGMFTGDVALPSKVSEPEHAMVSVFASLEIFLTMMILPLFVALAGRVTVKPPRLVSHSTKSPAAARYAAVLRTTFIVVEEAAGTYAETFDPETCQITLLYPAGAAGVVLLKFGEFTTLPLISITLMLPRAASIKTKSSATIGSHPLRLNPRFGVIGFALCT